MGTPTRTLEADSDAHRDPHMRVGAGPNTHRHKRTGGDLYVHVGAAPDTHKP